MRKIILFLVIGFLFGACSNNNENAEKTLKTTPQNTTNSVSENALPDEVIMSYLEIKDALVASDLEKARGTAQQIVQKDASSDIEEQLMAPIERIANTESLEEARDAFFEYSQLLTDMVAENGGSMKLYKQFCPMAFDNNGAFWLSAEKEILNPYFGDKMLRCGEVQAEY